MKPFGNKRLIPFCLIPACRIQCQSGRGKKLEEDAPWSEGSFGAENQVLSMKDMDIVTPDDLHKSEKIVTHKTPIGDVMFVVGGEGMTKSYVQAHYRHTEDGKLVFVEGYHNKVMKKPEDLKPVADSKYAQEVQDYQAFKAANPDKKKKAPVAHLDKYTSYHFGDEVFVKYSHMHDQHFGVGVVVGIRDDKSHDGKLVAVKLLDGTVEYYDPVSLVHVYKNNYEEGDRKYEVSHHKDDKGKPIPYQHLDENQRVKFYDLYKLWFRLHRMGELLAFKDNLEYFKKPDGSFPKSKDELSADQKIFLEKKNPYPVVPYEALLASVGQPEYNDGKHIAFAKKLLADIESLEKKGVASIHFPKLYKSKSKKAIPYVPAAWMTGLFPSTVTEEKPDKSEYTKLQSEIASATGLSAEKPSTKGAVKIDAYDLHYGKPIIHGKVTEPKPEGSKYKPAPKIPSAEEEEQAPMKQDLKAAYEEAEKVQPKPAAEPHKVSAETGPVGGKVGEKAATPTVPADKAAAPPPPKPVVPAEKAAKAEPKLVVGGEKEDISKLKFKVVANAKAPEYGFGGAHSKYILEDENGEKYLFKPYAEGLHRVWADIIPAKLAEAVGLPTAHMGAEPVKVKIPYGMGGNYQGVEATGSVQKLVKPLKHNNIKHWVANNFKGCPKHVVEQLQREHVLDWLIGNNDAHASQFIVDGNNDLIGIDKGQAFKYYESDVLDLSYDPNVNVTYGNPQVYNLLLQAAKDGHVQLDWGVVHEFIENNVSNLSQLQWTKMILPYAENSAKWAEKNTMKFQSLASKRKANLLFDFKKLYNSVGIATEYNPEKKKYEIAKPEPKPAIPEADLHQEGAFHQIDSYFHEQVLKSGAHGYSRMIGGGDIEDMNVLYTPYEWHVDHKAPGKTGKGLEVRFKLLQGAEQKILDWFETIEDESIQYINKNGALDTVYDPLSGVAINAAKTVNQHAPSGGAAPDGQYNPEKMQNFAKWFMKGGDVDGWNPKGDLLSVEELASKLMQKHITANNFDDYLTLAHTVATHYHKIAQDVMTAVANKNKTQSKQYSAWSGPHKVKQSQVSKAKHPYATWPKYELDPDKNTLFRVSGDKPAMHYASPSPYGCMFTKNLPGNIQVRYYPHYSMDLHGQNNYRSQQGTMIIDYHNWDGNIDAMHHSREVMKDIGVDNRLGTITDMECLYLTRIIWQNKGNTHYKNEYNKVLAMENSPKKIEALKALAAKTYNNVDPTSLPTYDPTPKWDGESGAHYFMNPYVLHHIHYTKPQHVKVAAHQLTGGTTDEKLQTLARYGLLGTEMRHKFNLPIYGISSVSDQASGGASYVYLNSQQRPLKNLMEGATPGFLVFRPELYARTDCFGYTHDHFGTTNYGWDSHGSMDDRLPIMEIVSTPISMYEVLFKNRVPLDKWFIGVNGKGGDSSIYGKVAQGWIAKLKAYVKKFRPHILNHSTWLGVPDGSV